MPHASPRRVAVLVETSNAYGRDIQFGIGDFAKGQQGRWSMFVEQHELGAPPPAWLLRQAWDGIISRPTTPALARAFRRMGVPVVDLNDLHRDLGFPRLQSDNAAIGQLAAGHLRDRGFARFAYCGFTGEPWAADRRDGFVAALSAGRAGGGPDVTCHQTPWRGSDVLPWAAEQSRLERWLRRLPAEPVGVFACNDVRARHVLEAARRLGIDVPDRVAVVGVDNDELLCLMSDPPLSSVLPDARRIGFAAAELLDRCMAGHRPTVPLVVYVPPRSVVTRRSTDTLAIDDQDVAAAVGYIRANACRGIRVDDVLRQVPLSRSVLDRRFREVLGRTPHAEIRSVQLRRAAQLLTDTKLPLKQIAARCGLAHMEYLSYLFKRAFGASPRTYRKARAGPGVGAKPSPPAG